MSSPARPGAPETAPARAPESAPLRAPVRRRLLRLLFERRERWSLTLAGKAFALVVFATVAFSVGRGLHAFLAVDAPAGSGFLVVEAWLPDYAFAEASRAFAEGRYRTLIAAGTIDEMSGSDNPREFFAAWKMMRQGVDRDRVVVARGPNAARDRTFHSALAVRDWLLEHGIRAGSVDVVTMGAHARRSRLLFAQALGDEFDVGVIPVVDRRFDPAHWWRSSAGVRVTIDETIAYAYARCAVWLRAPSPAD